MADKITITQAASLAAKLIAAVKNLISAAVAGVEKTLAAKVDDAPADGTQYARKDNAWVKVEAQGADDTASDDEFNAAIDKAIEDALNA